MWLEFTIKSVIIKQLKKDTIKTNITQLRNIKAVLKKIASEKSIQLKGDIPQFIY